MDELAKISVIDYSEVGRNPLVSGRFGASDFLYLTDGAGVGILDLEKIVIEQDYRNKTRMLFTDRLPTDNLSRVWF